MKIVPERFILTHRDRPYNGSFTVNVDGYRNNITEYIGRGALRTGKGSKMFISKKNIGSELYVRSNL